MKPQDVLAHPAAVLTEAQRHAFFDKGYVALPDYVPERWLVRLRAAMAELLERSRSKTETDSIYVLEEGHSAGDPRLHRVSSPQDQHPTFWEFMTDPVMTDLAADVVGPDVKFHHAKLNVKSGKGSKGFSWHQDIPAWPHTDFSPVTIGIYIDGCTPEQGPLTVAEGSHDGPLFSMYDDDGNYVVKIRDSDLALADRGQDPPHHRRSGHDPAAELPRGARSAPNKADGGAAVAAAGLFLGRFLSLHAEPDPEPAPGRHRARHAGALRELRHRPVEMPPDWRGGYKPVWMHKNKEARLTSVKCRTSRSLRG